MYDVKLSLPGRVTTKRTIDMYVGGRGQSPDRHRVPRSARTLDVRCRQDSRAAPFAAKNMNS